MMMKLRVRVSVSVSVSVSESESESEWEWVSGSECESAIEIEVRPTNEKKDTENNPVVAQKSLSSDNTHTHTDEQPQSGQVHNLRNGFSWWKSRSQVFPSASKDTLPNLFTSDWLKVRICMHLIDN